MYTQTNYNVAGEPSSTVDNDNQGVTYTRDVLGQPVRVTDAVGRQIRYEYDLTGRNTAVTAFATNAATVLEWRSETGYDKANNVTTAKITVRSHRRLQHDVRLRRAEPSEQPNPARRLRPNHHHQLRLRPGGERDPVH